MEADLHAIVGHSTVVTSYAVANFLLACLWFSDAPSMYHIYVDSVPAASVGCTLPVFHLPDSLWSEIYSQRECPP